MKREECFELGIIIKKVGSDGRILLNLDVDDPKQYLKTESLFLDFQDNVIPFSVKSFKLVSPTTAHLKLQDVDTEEQATLLIGSQVLLPLTALPKLTGNKFYFHEVIGWNIMHNESNLLIGQITDVLDNGPNQLFKCIASQQLILIPIVDEWIVLIDRENQTIRMNLPEGLVEVNFK
jgi:16S rRNA processing protein RimM